MNGGRKAPKPLDREEIAAVEVGHTDITRGGKITLIFLFLAVILGVPMVEIARDLGARKRPQSLQIAEIVEESANAGETSEGWVERSLAKNRRFMRLKDAYENDLAKSSLLSELLIPPAQSLLFSLGVGNGDVICGRDGWLFFKPGVDAILGRPFLDVDTREARVRASTDSALSPDPVLAIYEFAAALAERGITLVVVPAPTKLAIHPERLSSRFDGQGPALANPSRARFLHELSDFEGLRERYLPHRRQSESLNAEHRARMWFAKDLARFESLEAKLADLDVVLFDPTPVLIAARNETGQPQYLATDSHWRPEAAKRVAKALAERLRELGLIDKRTPWNPSETTTITGRGDLSRMLDLAAPVAELASEVVSLEPVPNHTPEGMPEVLLLGDSFTNIYSLGEMGWGEGGGLADQVARYLGSPIEVIARNDAGAHSTRSMLARDLAQGLDRLAGKKICIWEFAERELAVGDWRQVELATAAPATDPASTSNSDSASPLLELDPDDRVEVKATVLRITDAPRPGSVPYKDHIIYAELAELEATEPGRKLSSPRALVALYSMRDNTWTDAARWRPGERIRLVIESYTKRNAELGLDAINSTMFDDDLAYELPVWGEAVAAPPVEDGSQTAMQGHSLRLAPWYGLVLALVLAALITWIADRRERR
jgi:alginate O-acetyltransferase complex protein AlgJ